MSKINILFLLYVVGSLVACTMTPLKSTHTSLFDRAVLNLNAAVKTCTAKSQVNNSPSRQTLEKLTQISNEKLLPYLKYRYFINNKRCHIENGAAPYEYFSVIAYDKEVPYLTRKKSKKLLNLITNTHIIDIYNGLNNLTDKEIQYLNNIDYMQTNFDLVTVSSAIHEYKLTQESN